MKVAELRRGPAKGEITGEIVELGEVKTIKNRFGRTLKVVNGKLRDDSGEINIALWNKDAERFSEGDKVKITNGWVSEYNGELKLSPGKYGKIEKVE